MALRLPSQDGAVLSLERYKSVLEDEHFTGFAMNFLCLAH